MFAEQFKEKKSTHRGRRDGKGNRFNQLSMGRLREKLGFPTTNKLINRISNMKKTVLFEFIQKQRET